MNDHDVISILQNAATQGPAPRTSAEATLAVGRRSLARRRYAMAGGAMLSVAALGLLSVNVPFGQDAVVVSELDPTARTDGGPGIPAAEKPAPQKVSELNKDADAINTKVLAAALGSDFDYESTSGSLRPGTASAKGLPEVFAATAVISAMTASDNALPQLCRASEEKGLVTDGCTAVPLADGQTVQANFSRWAPNAAYPQETAGEGVRVLFHQTNGVLVYVDLLADTKTSDYTDETASAARGWLKSMLDRLGVAVTDPDVESQGFLQADDDPDPTEKQPATDEDAAAAKKAAIVKEKAAADENATDEDLAAKKRAIAEKEAAAQGDGPEKY
jgi:hypothetical protein